MSVRVLAFHLLLPMATILAACSDQEPIKKADAPPAAVVVTEIQQRAITLQDKFIGRVEATAKVELRARVQGFLKSRNFEEGSEVQQGAVLFEIEPDRYQALVDQSHSSIAANKARLTEADLRLKRFRKLRKSGTVSQQDLDEAVAAELSARASVEGSEAALAQAELDLSYTQIIAPFTGQIGASAYDEGNLVGPDSGVLATLIDLQTVDVPFNVSEVAYLQFVKARQNRAADGEGKIKVTLTLVLGDETMYPHTGEFLFIDNQVNRGTGTLTIWARFANPDRLLRPGMFVTLAINRDQDKQATLVPQTAVQTTQGGHSVLLVDAGNKVEQRAVKLGARNGSDWVVLEGLSPGEQVIVQGMQKTKPGETVKPTLIDQR